MKPILTLASAMFAFVVTAKAQNTDTQLSNFSEYMNVESRVNGPNADVEGSPYLSEEWAPGQVFFTTNFKLDRVSLRFNIYQNALEAYFQGIKYLVSLDRILGFAYTDPSTKKIWTFKKIDLDKRKNVFMRILSEGKVTFGAYYEMRRTRGEREGSGMEALNPVKDVLIIATNYYLISGENPPVKLSRSKKAFLKALPSHKTEMEDYLGKYKLNLKNDDDLIQAMSYYNAIEGQ